MLELEVVVVRLWGVVKVAVMYLIVKAVPSVKVVAVVWFVCIGLACAEFLL